MTIGQRASMAILVAWFSTASMTSGAEASSSATPSDTLQIRDAKGRLLWQAESRAAVDAGRIDADGRLLLGDGTLVDAEGRVRLRHLRLTCERLTFPPAQLELFPEETEERLRADGLIAAMDAIRKKYGQRSIRFGRTCKLQAGPI